MYPSMSSKSLWALLGLLALIWLVYGAGLSGGYFFDDFGNVDKPVLSHEAVTAHFWRAVFSSDSSSLHRPISMLTFALQAKFDVLTPFWAKLINVLIHSLNTLLVFGLARLLIGQVRRAVDQDARGFLFQPATLALMLAALWALAPIQLSAVLYVVQRMESLAALFTLLGLLLFTLGRIRMRDGLRGGWWRVLAGLVLCTPLAVLAKETGVLLPAYAFLIELFVFRFQSAQAGDKTRLMALYALVLFIPGVLGVWYTLSGALGPHGYAGRTFTLPERLLTELRIMVDYIHWIVLPTPYAFSFYHDDIRLSTGLFSPISTALSLIFIVGALVAAWVARLKYPLIALGVFFFFTGQSLVSTYLPLELVYEHRNYLPSFGVFLALVGLLAAVRPVPEKHARTQRLASGGVLLVVALFAAQTAFIAYQWRSPFTQAQFLAIANPDSTRAIFSFGREIQAHAEGYGSPSFNQAMRLYKQIYNRPDASINAVQALIVSEAKQGHVIPAAYWQVLEEKMQGPISAEDNSTFRLLSSCVGNGACKFQAQDLNRLAGIMVNAYNTHPDNAYLAQTFADFVFSILGRQKDAIDVLKDTLAKQPNNLDILADLTAKLWQMGEKTEAQTYFQLVVKLDKFDQYTTGLNNMMLAVYP